MSEPIRLATHVADVARCPPAEAEHHIEGGWVRVDGNVIVDPQW